MLDYYFRRPIFWDYIIAISIAFLFYISIYSHKIYPPKIDLLYSLVSDLATISLTLAGFVITLLTVIISFKSSETASNKEIVPGETVFQIFFRTSLYFDTVRHLRNAAASLTCVAITGYAFKLLLSSNIQIVLYLFNVIGIQILCLTLLRCLLILSKIVKLQRLQID